MELSVIECIAISLCTFLAMSGILILCFYLDDKKKLKEKTIDLAKDIASKLYSNGTDHEHQLSHGLISKDQFLYRQLLSIKKKLTPEEE